MFFLILLDVKVNKSSDLSHTTRDAAEIWNVSRLSVTKLHSF
jgi:hypothetical protein